ncbi:MAG TPA: acyloxyacyl hydrolase [Longimicrobiales bacterium]
MADWREGAGLRDGHPLWYSGGAPGQTRRCQEGGGISVICRERVAALLVRVVAVVAMATGLVGATASLARTQDSSFLTIGVGAFDVFGDDFRAAQFEVQYRPDLKLWIFQPMVGANVTTDESAYVYAGISLDVFLNDRVVLRPSFAPGLYHEGDGKDLGSALEFRSALEVAYRFDNRARLGLELSHRSNAGIDDRNPGEESLMLFYHWPLAGN